MRGKIKPNEKSRPGPLAGEQRFAAILSAAVDGIIAIDRHGIVTDYSPSCETIFGYAADEVIGQNVKMLMPSPYRENHDGYLANYLKTGEKKIIGIGREVSGRRKDGSEFPMDLSVGEYRVGKFHGFVGIVRDVTQRNEALRELSELRDEFHHASRIAVTNQMASALAHELNQPLTAVINYAEACSALLENGGDEAREKVSAYVVKAAEQAHRAGEIIRRLREFTQKGDTDRRVEDLNETIHDACALGLAGVDTAGVEIELKLSDSLMPVLIDKVQIQQVVTNLLRNGIEAMTNASPRKLTVATHEGDNDRVEVTVADTGPGLPSDLATRLFDPFTTNKANGMGLGLSICQTIVEAHGGEIEVSETGPSGTTFRFTLPVAETAEVR